MSEAVNVRFGSRALITLASLVIVIAGLRAAQSIIVPFLLSVFLAMLGVPLLVSLRRVGVPRRVAILLVVLMLIGLLAVLGVVIGSSATDFANALPGYRVRLDSLISSLGGQLEVGGIVVSVPTEVGELIDTGQLLGWAGDFVSRLAGVVSNFILVILTTIFILLEASGFSAKIKAALGRTDDQPLGMAKFMTQVHRYLIIKSAVSLATGLLLGLWVWALGVDFPVLWGLVAFLLNYIPNIGSIMAAVPPILVGLIQPQGGLTVALAVAVGYLSVNIVIGSIVEPNLMGERLGLSTLVVFLSLVFWGWVLGGVGMLLSVPLTMIVKILFQNSEELRWISVLLDKVPEDASMSAAP